jgi:hypothetical protein
MPCSGRSWVCDFKSISARDRGQVAPKSSQAQARWLPDSQKETREAPVMGRFSPVAELRGLVRGVILVQATNFAKAAKFAPVPELRGLSQMRMARFSRGTNHSRAPRSSRMQIRQPGGRIRLP